MTATTTSSHTPATGIQRHQMIFVNLPVADVEASRAFFTAVGYTFDEQMCNGQGLALQLGPNIYAMLLHRDFFASFHDAAIAERDQREVFTCLTAESREHVDQVVDAAVAAGGTELPEQGPEVDFMYGRAYADLDGHVWEIMWMDLAAAEQAGAFEG